VSERADVAAAVGAGVHLPERGLAVADARRLVGLVGASIHAPRETGADYAMLGPIFETPGKGPPLGVSALRGPGVIFAVGGIDGPERARACVDAGAHGVAVIRAVPRAAQIWAAVTSP
jgi:thiamine-phosphate pyrophosphorylase